MIEVRLTEINEDNWIQVTKLQVHENQKHYVGSPIGILARAYAFRNSRAKAQFIQVDDEYVGLLMVRDMEYEPKCYDLQQLLIDKNHQGKGYGKRALELILDELRLERKYEQVEVCVKQEDLSAVMLYEKVGFVDTGYIDPDLPSSLNLVYRFD